MKAPADIATQLANVSTRMASLESQHASTSTGAMPQGLPYRVPGYGSLSYLAAATSVAPPASAAATASSAPLPIHQINFPH
jgi:hypothetical protein